jgi:hypothetical protein
MSDFWNNSKDATVNKAIRAVQARKQTAWAHGTMQAQTSGWQSVVKVFSDKGEFRVTIYAGVTPKVEAWV